MVIRKEIEVKRKGLPVVIDVTYGTDLIQMEFKVTDCMIPAESSAVAYSQGRTAEVHKQICTIDENVISFTPEKGFFEEGRNELQLRVVHNNRSLFTFKCRVECQGSFAESDAEEVKRNSSLVEQLMTEQAVTKARLEEVLKLPDDGTEVEKAVNDIKVGADGKVYSSPGEAVRQQIGQVSEQIENVANLSTNDLFKGIRFENKIFGNSYLDNEMNENDNFVCTPILAIEPNKDYYLELPQGVEYCFFGIRNRTTDYGCQYFAWNSNKLLNINFPYIRICFAYNGYSTPIDVNKFKPKAYYKEDFDGNVKTLTFDMTQGGYISIENGEITNADDIYCGRTDMLKIPNNTKVILNNMRYNNEVPFGYAIYDKNCDFIRGGQDNAIEVTDSDKYIAFCDATTKGTHLNRTVCFVGGKSSFGSKTIAFSGDSITFGYDDLYDGKQLDNTWVNQVGNNLGVKKIINYGVSSASLMRAENTAQAIIDAYSDYDNDIDIIGFMIGINDAFRDYPFGEVNDTAEDTFCGCLHSLCKGMLNKWKASDGKSVFLMLYPQADTTLVNPNISYKGLNGWGAWNECVKDIAHKYAIPICDLYNNLGITPHADISNVYWGGTESQHSAHPTQIGANVFAKYISNWVKRTFEI